MSEVYNWWTVLYKFPDGTCVCRCRCGRLHKRRFSYISRGKIKKCKECSIKEVAKNNTKEYKRHGDRLYRIWCNMKSRCYNVNIPSYAYYGHKGIGVCDLWKNNFLAFKDWSEKNGYYDNLTIDRIDSHKDYCPENCRWTDKHIQAVNCSIRKDNRTGYRGVIIEKNKFFASIRINGKHVRIGTYTTPEEACIARDKFIIENNLNEYKLQILGKKDI